MNRITLAISRMEQQITDRVNHGLTTLAKVEETRKALDLNFEEHFKFQQLKSEEFLAETLSADEAQTVFVYLGGSPSHFNEQSAAVKATLTRLFQELLEVRVHNLKVKKQKRGAACPA